jgi:hypothetical protein
MFSESVFDDVMPTSDNASHSEGGRKPTAGEPPRVDLRRVLTGLRHLTRSAEPARVFAELTAICVPALCDEMVIDIAEPDAQRYRIRRPGTSINLAPDNLPQQGAAVGLATITGQSVTVCVTSLPGGGPGFSVRLTCTWHPGYSPTDTDAALVGVLADHATAVVHGERTTGQLADDSTAHQVGGALGRVQRVAAATGILMALHHLTATQARQLLARASDHTHRSLLNVADSVLHTGALPEHRTTQTVTNEQTETR